jgi:selenocysteine-specific elongation factor
LKNIVVGTSGHVDHGKSTMVNALTGIDPDRFAEEKKRGITIDLGFAHYTWQDEFKVSFVDVPGHEKFVHNMLAGAGGIQVLILVVAADGGVMPQTREHLHICHLLGVKHGFTVITRCDLVDEEMIELVESEILELTENTFLDNQAILKISSTTGEGLDNLKQTIATYAKQISPENMDDIFRFPVDRSFTLKGHGTVITGTVLSGKAELSDELIIYPQNEKLKIRGFQSHQDKVDTAKAGQRLAINVSGYSKDQILRGNQVSFKSGLVLSHVIGVELFWLPELKNTLKNKQKIRVYLHAQEITARIILITKSDIQESDRQYAQIRLEKPIICRHGDRFIIRQLSPLETIAGGKIIAPYGNQSRRNNNRLYDSLNGLAQDNSEDRIEEAIFLTGSGGIAIKTLPPLINVPSKQINKTIQRLSSLSRIICVDSNRKKYIHNYHVTRVAHFFKKALKVFHQKYPEKTGAPGTDFLGKMNKIYSLPEILILLNWTAKQGSIIKEDNTYRLPDFKGGLNKKQNQLKAGAIQLLKKGNYAPLGIGNLSAQLSVSKKELETLFKTGIAEKWIVRVKDDIWYLPDIISEIEAQLRNYFKSHETITIIEFKDLFDFSRKHAIGLLEYFDSQHLTRRFENYRILKTTNS